MSPPTERFSQLALDRMPPTTRLQGRSQQRQEELNSDSGAESEFEEDDAPTVIVSPSKLTYSLENLDEDIRDSVIDTFSDDPPQMTLKAYASRDQYVVFQVAESCPYYIQTGAEDSQFAVPTCGCETEKRPCRHLIWLFDQLSSQMLTNEGQTLTMTREGYAAELGNPFARISDFHVDVLADGLHCNPSSGPSPRRVQESREILASLSETPLDEYRPDLVGDGYSDSGGDGDDGDDPMEGGGRGPAAVVKRRDLEGTVFRMLLRNDEFFSYFLSSMPADELVNNRFRRLEQRAMAVLVGLDAYEASVQDPAASAAAAAAAAATAVGQQQQQRGQPRKDVEWCAAHLVLVLDQIYAAVQHAREPLGPWEQRAAARAVVRTLEGVVERAGTTADTTTMTTQPRPQPQPPRARRDLYSRLIGDRDRDFAVPMLRQLAPPTLAPWAARLAAVEDRILERGAPESYVKKLRSIRARLRGSRSSSSGSSSSSFPGPDPGPGPGSTAGTSAVAGSKRSSQSHDRSRAKRMK